jgi:hypothetical protein
MSITRRGNSARMYMLGMHRIPVPGEIQPIFKSGQIPSRPNLTADYEAGFTRKLQDVHKRRKLLFVFFAYI